MAHIASRDSVDRFCFRELSAAQYATLRTLQPCIVTTEPGDERRRALKGVKWIVLLADMVMITENPPKTISPLIAYRDITRVGESSEVPEFFKKGGERVRNVEITYRSHKPMKRGSTASTRTPRGSPIPLGLATSLLSLHTLDAGSAHGTGGRPSLSGGSASTTPVSSPLLQRAVFPLSPEVRRKGGADRGGDGC